MFIIIAGLMIGTASTYIEVKLVNSWGWLRDKYENGWGPIPGPWINNGFSIGLSALLGGGATVIAMSGMLFSTVLSNIYFSSQKKANEAGWTLVRFKSEMSKKGEEAIGWWHTNRQHFVNLGKTIMAFIKVITAPVRAMIWVNNKAHSGKENLTNMRNQAKVKLDEMRDHVRLVRTS
jgi:hypothetical protein